MGENCKWNSVVFKLLIITSLISDSAAQTRGFTGPGLQQTIVPSRQTSITSLRDTGTPTNIGNLLQNTRNVQRFPDNSRVSVGTGRQNVENSRMNPVRVLQIRNLQRTGGVIPQARSFQANISNARLDPRLEAVSRIRAGQQRGVRTMSDSAGIPSGPDSTSQQTAFRTLPNSTVVTGVSGSVMTQCESPRSVRCFSWPENRDTRDAYRCDGGCPGRTCTIPCECSCVHPNLIGRLRDIGRISGPELMPVERDVRTDSRARAILAIRNLLRQRQEAARDAAVNRQTGEPPQRRNDVTRDLSFGISDEVLATLIAQPVLNEIVGPQGINQIIAGEPPALLPRRRGTTGSQPDFRLVRTRNTIAEPISQRSNQETNMGIPVPLNFINFNPGTENDPSLGNMQMIMSELRPFEDPTTGLSIDLPKPTPVQRMLSSGNIENGVTVRQLPGSNVLFVDLTRQPPAQNQPSTIQSVSPRFERIRNSGVSQHQLSNVSPGTLSVNSWNTVPFDRVNQTQTGSTLNIFNGGNIQSFTNGGVATNNISFRNPTKTECVLQRLELWCDPQAEWDGTPGVTRWCLQNCGADNCDNQLCACACIDEALFKIKNDQLSSRAA